MARIPLPPGLMTHPVAHRALHDRAAGRVENSRAAIRAAIEHGYAIEIDLQLSADGQAMVFHDEDLTRLTGEEGLIHARTSAELAQIRLIDSEETVPTLAEVLDLVAGRAPLLVEIKDQSMVMGPTDGRLEAETARLLSGYTGEVAVMSFNPAAIYHMAQLAPDLCRGLTTSAYDPDDWSPLPAEICAHLRGIPDYQPTESSFISHEAGDLARPRVAELAAQGAAVLCWTIRSAQAEAEARKYARNITFEGYLAKEYAKG